MTETRNEYFDSESLARMGTALDEAWRTLPAGQQTPAMKIALAKAILHLATARRTRSGPAFQSGARLDRNGRATRFRGAER